MLFEQSSELRLGGGQVEFVRAELDARLADEALDRLHQVQQRQQRRPRRRIAADQFVRPPARFGGLIFDGDLVSEFTEKPQIGEGWINGGFFVLQPEVLDHIGGDDVLWERGPLESLAAMNQLQAYRHEGFWQPMDTARDRTLLESMWQSGTAPWKVWT